MEIKINIPDIESLPFIKNYIHYSKMKITNTNLPKKEAIYFLYNKAKELLYIGQTNNLNKRISCHRKLLKEYPFYSKFFLLKNTSRAYKIAIENLLIDRYAPKLNIERNTEKWRK